MGCNCAGKRYTVFVLSFEDDREGGEYVSRTDAEIANVRKGGGGVIRQILK